MMMISPLSMIILFVPTPTSIVDRRSGGVVFFVARLSLWLCFACVEVVFFRPFGEQYMPFDLPEMAENSRQEKQPTDPLLFIAILIC